LGGGTVADGWAATAGRGVGVVPGKAVIVAHAAVRTRSGIETDASGWQAVKSCPITRTAYSPNEIAFPDPEDERRDRAMTVFKAPASRSAAGSG